MKQILLFSFSDEEMRHITSHLNEGLNNMTKVISNRTGILGNQM